MNISLATIGRNGVLRGRPLGRKHFAEICEQLAASRPGEFVLLDFKGVKSVNGSWLNAAVAELFRWAGEESNNIFPVLCRFPLEDLDELDLVAQINGQIYPLADDLVEPVRHVRLIGPLDEALKSTLQAVVERGTITGARLYRENRGEGIGATAWNNRLKDLYDLRLLNRRKHGRRQLYTSVAKEIDFNG